MEYALVFILKNDSICRWL